MLFVFIICNYVKIRWLVIPHVLLMLIGSILLADKQAYEIDTRSWAFLFNSHDAHELSRKDSLYLQHAPYLLV